jgi:hypothetical protein
MNEFNDYSGSADDLRREIAEHQRGTPETPAENAKTLAEDTKRLDFILRSRTEDVGKEDRDHLLRMLQEGLKTL